MDTILIVFTILNILALMTVSVKRYLDLLYIFQLEKYKMKRFILWFVDHLWNRSILLPTLLSLVQFILVSWFNESIFYAIITLLISLIYLPFLFKKKGRKVKFVYTFRIRRFIAGSLVVALNFYLITRGIVTGRIDQELTIILLSSTVINFLIYDIIVIAYYVMQPIEIMIGKSFIKKAQKKLATIQPDVIGITGSYGKTSTKMILANILNQQLFVCFTPKSFNTPFGISMTINNHLRNIDKVLVCEMGATKKGDIEELVNIAHPKIGILTEIGPQHLDTFHNIQTIIKTKFELVEGLPLDGLAVLNYDNRYIRGYHIVNPVKVVRYGILHDELDYRAVNVQYGTHGSTFEVIFPNGQKHAFRTKLLGVHNIYNVLAAIVVADHYNMDIDTLKLSVQKVESISHRLELKQYDNYTIIDDAFNSNIEGFGHALDILGHFTNRRVIITPGIIELGDKHYAINHRLAQTIAPVCDYVVLVGKKQTEPIYEGLMEADYPKDNIFITNDFQVGLQQVINLFKRDFTLLIENDLPDNYTEE